MDILNIYMTSYVYVKGSFCHNLFIIYSHLLLLLTHYLLSFLSATLYFVLVADDLAFDVNDFFFI